MNLKTIGIYSLANKCGKTTTAVYLSESLAMLGYHTLLINSQSLNGVEITEKGYYQKVKVNGSLSSWFKTDSYDLEPSKLEYKIIDLAPNDEIGLKKCDLLIIPVEISYFGLDSLKKTLIELKKYPNKKIRLLQTKVDESKENTEKIINYLFDFFSEIMYNSNIKRNFYLGLPNFTVKNLNNSIPHFGLADYLKLCNEIIESEKNG